MTRPYSQMIFLYKESQTDSSHRKDQKSSYITLPESIDTDSSW